MGIKSVNYPLTRQLGEGTFEVERGDDCDGSAFEKIARGYAYEGGTSYPLVDLAEFAKYDIGTGNIQIPNLESNLNEYAPLTFNAVGVAYGDGVYIAVGNGGAVGISNDSGNTWTVSSPGSTNLQSIAYGGDGKFVAVGGTAYIYTEDFGVTWNNGVIANLSFITVCYGNGMWVAGPTASLAYYSTDGINWNQSNTTQVTFTASGSYFNPDNNTFYFVGTGVSAGSGVMFTSTDAINFQMYYPAQGYNYIFRSITYGNSRYVMVGNSGMSFSTDGTTWMYFSPNNITGIIYEIIFDGTKFILVGEVGIATSTDGITWTIVQESGGTTYRAIVLGDRYLAFGLNVTIAFSTDGTTWQVNSIYDNWYDITYGNGVYVAVAAGGYVGHSTSGSTFDVQRLGTNDRYFVTFDGTQFIIPNGINSLRTSTDGVNWTIVADYVPLNPKYGIAYGNGTYVEVGHSTNVYYTNAIDGTAWESVQPYTGSSYYWDITFANGYFAICGNNATVMFSADGATWEHPSSIAPVQDIRTISKFQDGFVAIALNGAFWYTEDRFSWQAYPRMTSGNVPNGASFYDETTGTLYVGSSEGLHYTNDLVNWQFLETGATINGIYANGTTLALVGNKYIYVSTLFYGTFIDEPSLLAQYMFDSDSSAFVFAYDYNTDGISDIGDYRLNSDPIKNNIRKGQYVTASYYDLQCNISKALSVKVNGGQVVGETSQNRHIQYWVDTTLLDVNEGDTLSISITRPDGAIDEVEYNVEPDCYRYALYYLNKFGAVDTLLIEGAVTESYSNDRFMINNHYDRSEPMNHQYQVIQNTALKSYTLNTGDLSDAQSKKMDHLMLSPKIWLHDLEDEIIYAAYISNPSYAVNKRSVNNETYNNYTFDITIAQDIIRRG